MNTYYLIIVILINFSCQSELKIIELKVPKSYITAPVVFDSYTKEINELRTNISNGRLPKFIFNECFICECRIPIFSSEGKIDCFESMLDSLSYDEIEFLATYRDSAKLINKCQNELKCSDKNDLKKSRWETIQYVYNKKKLIKNLPNYYSRNAIPNQSGFDTSFFYVKSYVTRSRAKSHTIYKFYSNGTYTRFQAIDGQVSSDLKSNICEIGQYYVMENPKILLLEYVYPDNDFSKVILDKLTFKINKNGIDLISRQSSNSNQNILISKSIFKAYKRIVFR